MTYLYPWAFALPILLLAVFFLRGNRAAGVPFPSLDIAPPPSLTLRGILRVLTLTTLSLLFLFFLTIAAARPQRISMLPAAQEARNILIALDISGSMRTRDFQLNYRPVSRLDAVKAVVEEFIEGRPGDRIGLVVFGSQAYLECPLTSDHTILSNMVQELEVGLAGDGTAIGDGLGIALKRIQHIEGSSKAIILLTDGVHTAGTVNPLQAAQVAADVGVKIHTIGIGSPNTASRARLNPLLAGGKQFEFDEKTLRQIATISNGVYFNAANLEELQRVYEQIDILEQTTSNQADRTMVTELYPQYAWYAFLCFVLYLLMNNLLVPRLPW